MEVTHVVVVVLFQDHILKMVIMKTIIQEKSIMIAMKMNLRIRENQTITIQINLITMKKVIQLITLII